MGQHDGGPAFPEIETSMDYDKDAGKYFPKVYSSGGMTLRDYFAAKAMAAIYPVNFNLGVHDKAELAREAYEVADALIAAGEAK